MRSPRPHCGAAKQPQCPLPVLMHRAAATSVPSDVCEQRVATTGTHSDVTRSRLTLLGAESFQCRPMYARIGGTSRISWRLEGNAISITHIAMTELALHTKLVVRDDTRTLVRIWRTNACGRAWMMGIGDRGCRDVPGKGSMTACAEKKAAVWVSCRSAGGPSDKRDGRARAMRI